jgi:hypothetical protein
MRRIRTLEKSAEGVENKGFRFAGDDARRPYRKIEDNGEDVHKSSGESKKPPRVIHTL